MLEAFTAADLKLLHDIRNEPGIRAGMLNKRLISWADHQRWVGENILSSDRVRVFFIHRNDAVAGFVSLKSMAPGSYEAGVFIRHEFARGPVALLATIALADIAFGDLKASILHSNVPKSNIAALKFNQRLGAALCRDDENYHYLKFEKAFYEVPIVRRQLAKWGRGGAA